MNDSDTDLLFYAAFSYALGRTSYIVGDISRLCINNLDKIKQITKVHMVNRIDEYIKKGIIGMPCDERQWLKLKKAILNVD